MSQLIRLDLTAEEVNGILGFMGELPTKAGVWPLAMKIKAQAEAQTTPAEQPEAEAA